MERRLEVRTNDAWLAALRSQGPDCSAAVRDLEQYLRRALSKIVPGRLSAEDLSELLQESLTRIVESLDSFRGDSAFTTWATAIATRVAFTEARRRQVRRERPGAFDALRDEIQDLACPQSLPADAVLSRANLLQALEHAIATSLTERQRLAVLAELRGIPTIEIADQLGTNQNALYKLVHDARKKLRRSLLSAGFTAESLHDHAAEAAR